MELLLNKEELKQVRDLAGLFFSPLEIGCMLGHPAEELSKLAKRPGNPIYDAYQGGKLEKEMLHRKGVTDLALRGSSPAQTMVRDMINMVNAKLVQR